MLRASRVLVLFALLFCSVLLPRNAHGATQTTVANRIAIEKYMANRVAEQHRQDADRTAEQHRQDARDALFQTIVDKGFLALIVAFIGFLGSKALDRYQSQLAADSTIEKQRFDHLDEVWTLIHQCEHVKQEMYALVCRGVKWHTSKERLADHKRDFHEKAKSARQKVDETAHWLGPYVCQELIAYHNMLATLVEAYGEEDLATASRLEHQLRRRKRYIADPRRLSLNRWDLRIG
jgi:hypothetical protein